jgi:hypothetical protein
LAASTSKKVMVERYDKAAMAGYIQPDSFLTPTGLEMLTLSGAAALLPYAEVKLVHFVREFEDRAPSFARRTFGTRPRTGGLWVRLAFRDGAILEAVMTADLLQNELYGFYVNPPEATQRVFVPRAALRELLVLGVSGSRTAARRGKEKPGQFELFDNGDGSNTTIKP